MQKAKFDTLEFTVPSELSEITLDQARQLSELTTVDSRRILLALSGKSEAEFRGLKIPLNKSNIAAVIEKNFSFVWSIGRAHEYPLLNSITVAGKEIRIPDDLGAIATVAEWWDIEDELAELQKARSEEDSLSLFEIANLLLSVFLCEQISGKPYTDITQARQVAPLVGSLPCTVALPIAAFFLGSLVGGAPFGSISFRQIPTTTIKLSLWPIRWREVWRRLIGTFKSVS